MATVRIRPRAQEDLKNARDWYNERRLGLGGEFLREVNDAVQRVASMPESYQLVEQGIRRALVRRFPYSLYYLFENDEVVVLAALHQR